VAAGLELVLEKKKKELNSELKTVRDRLNVLKKEVMKFLDDNDEEGLNYKGILFVKQEKKKARREKKEDKNKRIIEVLRNAGIKKPDDILQEIQEASKGPKEEVANLAIKNLVALDTIEI
jgi:hypothetical protein